MTRGNTTANEPVEAIDPGGTHPTKGKAGKGKPEGDTPAQAVPQQKVESGDRNTMPKGSKRSK